MAITGIFLLTVLIVGKSWLTINIITNHQYNCRHRGNLYTQSKWANQLIPINDNRDYCLDNVNPITCNWVAHAYTRHNSKYTHWYISLRGITELVIKMTGGNGIKYETMTFLTLPPKDVFLASVLIGTLGAIMDVAITISSGMYEILQRTPNITMGRWALAGRHIGQDIMGTMTNILLFLICLEVYQCF